MNDLIRRGGVLTLLRGPFKRKSATPQPTTPTVRNRNRFHKQLQPRSQSLGSLSVITSNDECKTNLRLSASVEANNTCDNDAIVLFNPVPNQLSLKNISAARRNSMLCVIEEPLTNIYAELEVNDNQFSPIACFRHSTDTAPSQQCVEIEINHIAVNETEATSVEGNCRSPVLENSIDAHLDKIDEINRTLDDKLKRSLPQTRFLQSTSVDLNAIESNPVEHRVDSKDIQECASKRTSSSSSDSRPRVARKDSASAAGGKKRSMSFSHKSINTILHNIKEFKFTRSPLSRGHKAAASTEDREINEILEGVTVLSKKPCPVNNPTEPLIEPPVEGSESDTTTKSKIKMPKMKKSKAIRNTFRSKLINFQMRRGKTCKSCSKRRRIHPSKSVFDFAKDFNLGNWNEEEYCACTDDDNHHICKVSAATNTTNDLMEGTGEEGTNDEDDDDVLSMKDHNYCEPTVAGVSSESIRRSDKKKAVNG